MKCMVIIFVRDVRLSVCMWKKIKLLRFDMVMNKDGDGGGDW